MKRYQLISFSIICILFACCNRKSNQDFVLERFKILVEKNGMHIDSIDNTGLIYLKSGEYDLKASLDNLRKDFKRDKDTSIIDDFVQKMLSVSKSVSYNWNDVKDSVYWKIVPKYDTSFFNSSLHETLTEDTWKTIVVSHDGRFTWITKDDLSEWKITKQRLDSQINANSNKLLEYAKITFDTIAQRKLGMIEIEHTSLKSSLLLASDLKKKVKQYFGFPIYAVIPVRDFCYIFSQKDFEFFSKRIGDIVVDEYTNSGYSITTEILKISDRGIESVGKFPVSK